MATAAYDGVNPVAVLHFCSKRRGKRRQLFPREQFDVGRDDVRKLLSIEALTISTHHLRFRCVVYEEEDEHMIAPMIYFRVLSFNSVELERTDAGNNTGITVSRGHGDILLSDGDVLRLTPDIYLQFQYRSCVELHVALDSIQRIEARCFQSQFLLSGRRLGVGGQASVYIAIEQKTKRQVACKAVPLPKIDEIMTDDHEKNFVLPLAQQEAKLVKQRQDLAREYVILEKLDHPNIVRLEKVVCATYDIFIFQELITGGDLLSYLDQNGPLAEPQAAAIALQLVKAVDYLHINGCAHRDIKPENILMTSWRDGARIVLTDFGQARMLDSPNTARKNSKMFRMQTIVGTYGYTAPEIFEQMKRNLNSKGYSKAVDIWSVGCVTAALLTGDTIFNQDQNDFAHAKKPPSESTCRKRWDVKVIDKHELWRDASRKAKSFVRGCLVKDEMQRMTAKQALLHEWFTNKHYASELAAAYERAVADWEPRKQNGSLIEFIDTADAVSNAATNTSTANSQAGRFTLKHFSAAQKTAFPLPTKATPAVPPKTLPTPQSAMSRAAKETALKMGLTSPSTLAEYTFASPVKPDDGFSLANRSANSSTTRLSIMQYAPPQTQFTVQLQQHRAAGPSESLQNAPTQTQANVPLFNASRHYENDHRVRAQDAVPVHADDRPFKKVCR